MSSDVAIRVRGLTKNFQIYNRPQDRLKQSIWRKRRYYTEFKALDNVSFEVKKGETFGVVGNNGSGKSTLLQIICGTLASTAGTVEVNGRVAALLELGAGFNPEFTGRENVYMNAAILGLSRKEIEGKFDDIVAFADIGDFLDQPAKTYSSGMYVRLAFSVAMNVDPDILIVDEALAVGDAYFVHRCNLRFKEMQKQGKTILLVTHDASAVKRMCQSSIWLNDGAVEMIGRPKEVVDRYLAFLFKRPVVDVSQENSEPMGKSAAEEHFEAATEHELSIPNMDRRTGDQACSIKGVGLYDVEMRPICSTVNDSEVMLRLSFVNNELNPLHPYAAGYILRNYRGEEIASTNSVIEQSDLGVAGDRGEIVTARMLIDIPILHPGSYSLTPTLGYINDYGDIKLGDRIDNAIVFEITSDWELHTMMKLRSKIVREELYE